VEGRVERRYTGMEDIDPKLERKKNKNRGYRKLRAWQKAVELYALICEKIDALHYEAEGYLLRLVDSLQEKQQEGEWQDNFLLREAEAEYFVAEKE